AALRAARLYDRAAQRRASRARARRRHRRRRHDGRAAAALCGIRRRVRRRQPRAARRAEHPRGVRGPRAGDLRPAHVPLRGDRESCPRARRREAGPRLGGARRGRAHVARAAGAAPRGGRSRAQSDGGQSRCAAAHPQADGREARHAVARAGSAAVSGCREGPRRGGRRAHGSKLVMTSILLLRRIVVVALAALAYVPALAFGPAGHRIAGDLAEPLLCERTAQEIAALTGGERLAEIGLWADRVRGEDAWRHTGPWHYMNIDDDASIDAFEHPRDGDVLWAIQRHVERLAEPGARERRAEALRFLVHFIVDVHQPLHVGRESDRGGNEIDVVYRGRTTNLHRFWDTDVIRLDGLDEDEYAARVAPLTRVFA